jgi:hypothetical protein
MKRLEEDHIRVLRIAQQHEEAAVQNFLWREHFRKTLPPGPERRTKLWRLSFHMRKARDRAAVLRRFVGVE